MRLLAKVHNLTDFEGKVDVSLNIKGGGGFKDRVTIDIKKHSVTDCIFKSHAIPLAKSITLTAKARAGDTADTLVVKLPVRPWGMEYVASEGGIASGNAAGILELPAGREYSWRELEVSLSPSVKQALFDAQAVLCEGDLEQAMSLETGTDIDVRSRRFGAQTIRGDGGRFNRTAASARAWFVRRRTTAKPA